MQVQGQRSRGLLFSILTGISWGTFGVFSTLCLSVGVSDNALILLSPLALLAYFGIRVCMKPRVLKGIPVVILIGMLLHGGIVNNFMNLAYTKAYAVGMPVAVVSIVVFCQIFVIMIESYFVFKQKITLQKALAAIVAVCGVSLVLGLFSSSTNGQISFAGSLWALAAVISSGTGMVLASYWLEKGVDSDAFMLCLSVGSIIVMSVAFVNPVEFITNISGVLSSGGISAWLAVFGIAAIPNIFCYAIQMEALKRIDPSAWSICMSFDPVTATVLGLIVFGQVVTGTQVLGIIIILLVVAYMNWMELQESKKAKAVASAALDRKGA